MYFLKSNIVQYHVVERLKKKKVKEKEVFTHK